MLDEDLKALALDRLADAEVLMAQGRFAASYYLAGYCVECALKAVIARMIQPGEFPDKTLANAVWTHDFDRLLIAVAAEAQSRGRPSPTVSLASDPTLKFNWKTVSSWTEASRYQKGREQATRDMVAAITDPNHGVLQWIRKYW